MTSPSAVRRALLSLVTCSALAASPVVASGSADAAPGPGDIVRSYNATAASIGAIPDGPDTAGSCSTTTPSVKEVLIPVSGITGPLSDVRLKISMEHDKLGDIGLQLVAPDGTTGGIIDRIGAASVPCGDDSGLDGTFSFYDGAPGNLAAFAAAHDAAFDITSGAFFPSTAGGNAVPLSAPFAGVDGNGTWKLRILDYQAGVVGRVYAATLTLAQVDRSKTTACAAAKSAYKAARSVYDATRAKVKTSKANLRRAQQHRAPRATVARLVKKKLKAKARFRSARGPYDAASVNQVNTCGR